MAPTTARDQDVPDGENYEARAYYGAIAYSPSTRAHGWAYDYGSRGEAEQRALDQCNRHSDDRHAEDCVVPVWFRNACGALAVGSEGYGSGWGVSRKAAETFAIQSCSRYSGECSIVRWVCTAK
jgi:serine/threonine-protein kinase